MTPRVAMVLAAGRGERMRPLTDSLPKPLVEVGGKALLDHTLDRLADAGVARAVVNVWHLAETIAGHLAERTSPAIEISREDTLLETGGGIVNVLSRLGADAFYAINGDVLWRDGGDSALVRLAEAWDDAAMDALLLLQPMETAVGFDGAGDFFLDPDGQLRRRGDARRAPYAFMGVQILHPRVFADAPAGAFSLNLSYDHALANHPRFGLVQAGEWLHVGTVAGLAEAERRWAEGGG